MDENAKIATARAKVDAAQTLLDAAQELRRHAMKLASCEVSASADFVLLNKLQTELAVETVEDALAAFKKLL